MNAQRAASTLAHALPRSLVGFPALAGLVVLLGVAAGGCNCGASRPLVRCSIVAAGPAAPGGPIGVPELKPAAADSVLTAASPWPEQRPPLQCRARDRKALDGGPLFADPVDELTAIVVGKGRVSTGEEKQVCPPIDAKLAFEPPSQSERPCGPAACENKQVAIRSGALTTHVLFYDDPSLHRPENASLAPSGACYYRLWAVGTSWEGAGW